MWQTSGGRKFDELESEMGNALEEMQDSLFRKASEFLEKNTRKVKTYGELKEILENKKGIVQAVWCGDGGCEDKIKEETKAKIISIPFNQNKVGGNCIYCNNRGKVIANFARSY